ncbi:hypothetical protein EFQ36_00215 [Limosilactobacillus fermentum]|nr:hypothetical protein [Limosilactobacillus fermentum]
MLKVIQLFIGQSWELILNIIQWISINISVGWLAFGLAVITFLRNRHKKLRQSFEYSSENNNFETAISIYNDSLGTEASKLLGIMVTDKKFYLYRKLMPYIIRVKLRLNYKKQYEDKGLYPYLQMVNIQNGDEIASTGFIPVKSHEMRTIVIPKGRFLKAVKNRLMLNYKALKRFVNKKPVYIYFIYQTMSGTVKEFVLETDYQDALGKDLDREALENTLAAQDKYKRK